MARKFQHQRPTKSLVQAAAEMRSSSAKKELREQAATRPVRIQE